MKLFFCDICNESIPLQDIKENRSTTIKGKIFCRKCNPLNELGGPTGGAAPGAGGGRGLLGVVALLLVVVIGGLSYLIYDTRFARGAGAAEAADGERPESDARLRELAAAVDRMQVQIDELAALTALADRVNAAREEQAALAGTQAKLMQDVAGMQAGLVAVGSLREKVDALLLQQEESTQKIDRAERALLDLKTQIALVGEGAVARPGPADDAAVAAPADDAAAGLDPEALNLVEKLTVADPLARWEAVDQIRRRGDRALIPHVIPLLDDRDTFVRAQAIYTVGELKATAAVPKLVKLLRDDEITIREEALTSLVVITGENMKFDVAASRTVRDKGVKRWEDWLEKNAGRY